MSEPRNSPLPPDAATRADLKRVFGDLEDDVAAEILALRPTIAEVEAAALWAKGQAEPLGEAGRPLDGNAAAIFDIVTADDEDEM
jgi:hypothetical protein